MINGGGELNEFLRDGVFLNTGTEISGDVTQSVGLFTLVRVSLNGTVGDMDWLLLESATTGSLSLGKDDFDDEMTGSSGETAAAKPIFIAKRESTVGEFRTSATKIVELTGEDFRSDGDITLAGDFS